MPKWMTWCSVLIAIVILYFAYTFFSDAFSIFSSRKFEKMNDDVLRFAKVNITSKWLDIPQTATDITIEEAVVKKTETADAQAQIFKARVVLKGTYTSSGSKADEQTKFKITKYFLLRQTKTADVFEVSPADSQD